VPEPRIVTTSWDDGDALDLTIAELLRSRGLAGTFYVPVTPYQGRPALQQADLRSLSSQGFEVGAHSLSHRNVASLSPGELDEDVRTCKQTLEDVIGREVRMFCYPWGRYNRSVIKCLRGAGYLGARTTRMLEWALDFKPFEMPTTLQAYPHRTSTYLKNLTRSGNWRGAVGYLTQFAGIDGWVELGKRLFDLVLQRGGVWHLYGHSWEIEEVGLWEDLRDVLDYVCRRRGVTYVPNGDLMGFLERQGSDANGARAG
jgi:peptidoglycan-N-acetylglucosamine deacetylase